MTKDLTEGQMRPGAPGKLLETGGAIDATGNQPLTDVAKRKVGRRSRGPQCPRFLIPWNEEMDEYIRQHYRYLCKDKTLRKGKPAYIIAEELSKAHKCYVTANAVIGRFNREIKRNGRNPDTPAPPVPQATTRTPSLPKLKFLGDEQ